MRLVGFEPYDLPVKSRLLYQLSYRRKSIFCFRHFAFCFRFVFLITFNSPVYLFCIFSHVPDINVGNISWHGGARTHDTLVNGQALYLAELRTNISLRAKPSPVNHIQPKPYAKWSIRESNPPPPACKTGVAPLRLIPHIRRQPSCRHLKLICYTSFQLRLQI